VIWYIVLLIPVKYLAGKIISEVAYNVSSVMLNSTLCGKVVQKAT